MCGRFTLTTPVGALVAALPGVALPEDYRPRYNIAPTQNVLALRWDDGAPRSGWLRWGLVPFWAKDPGIGNRMINARAETVASKPAFRAAYRQRRCAVLADGFYEWQRVGSTKVPTRIHLAGDRPFAIAGLWERWSPDDGEPLETCTLITTAANPAVEAIHDRMPVILQDPDVERWLDPDSPRESLQPLLVPYPGRDLEAYAVSTLVNSPRNDVAECLAPA